MISQDKPYYSLNQYLREIFGTKTIKLSIDAGFTCPNRDGRLSSKGCLFCGETGSGDFADRHLSIASQISQQIELLSKKWPNAKYLAYFQAYTNTYGPVFLLERKYREALEHPSVCGLAVATRPDCLEEGALALLEQLCRETFLWVELGFQTSNEKTALFLNRGYANQVFQDSVQNLHNRNIPTVAHVILGLPGEDKKDILQTIDYLNQLPIQGIKFHMLYIRKDTPLFTYYQEHPFPLLSRDEYIEILAQAIGMLRPDIVVHRLTGDSPQTLLFAPQWTRNKKTVLNQFHHYLKANQITQGCLWKKM